MSWSFGQERQFGVIGHRPCNYIRVSVGTVLPVDRWLWLKRRRVYIGWLLRMRHRKGVLPLRYI